MNHNVTSLIICLRNAFAIIASDYYDHISLLPISDEWENIYHLLIRAQSD